MPGTADKSTQSAQNRLLRLNLRIRGRLYAGFGLLLLFCAGLAGFATWQLGVVQVEIDGLKVQSENAIRAGDIVSELYAGRRAILRYVFDQDEAAFVESGKHFSKTAELLKQAAAKTTSAERRALYEEAARQIVEVEAKRVALGNAAGQIVAGRNLLLTGGDKMAADLQKLVDLAEKTDFARDASALATKVLLVRVANWRTLASRDAKGITTFRSNLEKVQQQIAELEKADLPKNLAALLAEVKADVAKYSEAFDKTAPNLLLSDELLNKSITPLTVKVTTDMETAKVSIGEHFATITREAQDRMASTITTQEIVAGAAVLLGLLIAFFIARGSA